MKVGELRFPLNANTFPAWMWTDRKFSFAHILQWFPSLLFLCFTLSITGILNLEKFAPLSLCYLLPNEEVSRLPAKASCMDGADN